MKGVLFVATVTLITALLFGLNAAVSAIKYASEVVDEGRLYQVPYGAVLCASYQTTPCGVTLSRCADTYEYHCLTNVRFEAK